MSHLKPLFFFTIMSTKAKLFILQIIFIRNKQKTRRIKVEWRKTYDICILWQVNFDATFNFIFIQTTSGTKYWYEALIWFLRCRLGGQHLVISHIRIWASHVHILISMRSSGTINVCSNMIVYYMQVLVDMSNFFTFVSSNKFSFYILGKTKTYLLLRILLMFNLKLRHAI